MADKILKSITFPKLPDKYIIPKTTVDPTPTQGSTNAVSSGGVYDALAGKVDAETGKGLSTNDYSDIEKQKVTDATADLTAMTTATAEDVGKALKAKTVSGGKVTEWEFGETVELDNTLSVTGEAADAKATGDAIHQITGGDISIQFAPVILNNKYIRSDNGKIATLNGAKMFYIECDASTKYVIQKMAGACFTVGYTNVLPVENVICNGYITVRTGTETEIETSADAQYLCVWYYRTSDTETADTLLASVVIKKHYMSQIPPVDATLTEGGAAADAKVVGSDLLKIKGGVYQVDITPTTKEGWYIRSSDNTIQSQGSAKLMYFPCNANTDYIIEKSVISNRFTIGCTSEIPEVGTLCSQVAKDPTATRLEITTTSDAQYIAVFYWYSDTSDADAVLASISVSADYGTTLEYVKGAVGNLETIGKQTTVYVASVLGADGRDSRFPAIRELMDIAQLVERDPSGDYSSMFTKADYGIVCRLPMYNTRMFTGYNFDILFQQGADTQAVPASITKVMSLVTGLDYIYDLNEQVTVINADVASGSGSAYADGDILSIRDIMLAMMIESSNTLSNAFARHCGAIILRDSSATRAQCMSAFIAQMNKKAVEIGMTNSNFDSAHGASYTNLTTAHDMLLATIYASGCPDILDAWRYVGSKTIHVYGTNERDVTLTGYTTDALGNGYYVNGGKTGGLNSDVASCIMIATVQ